MSCDNEVDPIVTGDWHFYTLDSGGSKPALEATFKIEIDGHHYLINDLDVTIDGTSSDGFNSQIEGRGNTLDKIILTDGINEITMYGGLFLRTDWVLFDSVVYTKTAVRYLYPGNRLVRP